MILKDFLKNKPLYYNKIDYDRFPRIYKKIEKFFTLPHVVHIVGTNAKGSTGRTLAHLLHKKGLRVGHYSSPHISKFNERIWIDGEDVSDDLLESMHKKLQTLLLDEDSKALSYFEYTTLLAMLIFCEFCEYVVLEAGLGGEFDATNVFDKQLSIITPIGFDHEAFLGNTLEKIATTKLRSVRGDLLLAKQYEKDVYELALKRVEEVGSNLYLAQSYLDDEFYKELKDTVGEKKYPQFFEDNFSTAFCAYELLGFRADTALLEGLEIFGRCQKIEANITIDVGHNPMAARALLEHFKGAKIVLIYNSYDDKEYGEILKILKSIIKEVQILEIADKREVSRESLEGALKLNEIKYKQFDTISSNEEYLVFGSFRVVEEFLSNVSKK